MQIYRNEHQAGGPSRPHIYRTTLRAFQMMKRGKKQAVIVSGESGAGKTETTKHCLSMLTFLSDEAMTSKDSSIIKKILSCNPILEAFGNAQTARNQNSSRFGKYLRLHFDGNKIIGATIDCFLLEKSRITALSELESSFHVLHTLNGNKHGLFDIPAIDCAFRKVGFEEQEIERIWSILKAILLLLDLRFDDTDHKTNESLRCEVLIPENLATIAQILMIDPCQLKEMLTLERKDLLRQSIYVPLNSVACANNLKTLCKALYSATFEFILRKMEEKLRPATTSLHGFRILDIFGFENIAENSLEQLCINYANQKLLELYNQAIFQDELRKFQSDGLEQFIDLIKPPTNHQVIDLLSAKVSVFSIINDLTFPRQFNQSHMIQGFQQRLTHNLKKMQKDNNKIYFKGKKPSYFVIHHSHCSIEYCVNGFKKKNQDKVTQRFAELINNSYSLNTPQQYSSIYQSGENKKDRTILSKFNKEIENLLIDLKSCQIHFVRCLKPNNLKMPGVVDESFLLNQIKYLGILQTVHLRKQSFPYRMYYEEFNREYFYLQHKFQDNSVKDHRQKSKRILNAIKISDHKILFGKCRIYYTQKTHRELQIMHNEALIKLKTYATQIQRYFKNKKSRKTILLNLHKLCQRIHNFKRFIEVFLLKIKSSAFSGIQAFSNQVYHQKRDKLLKLSAILKKKGQFFILLNNWTQKTVYQQYGKFIKLLKDKQNAKTIGLIQNIKQSAIQNLKRLQTRTVAQKSQIQLIIDEELALKKQFSAVMTIKQKDCNSDSKIYSSNNLYQSQSNRIYSDFCFIKYDETVINPKLDKLKAILAKCHQDHSDQNHLKSLSDDCRYSIDQIPFVIFDRILNFSLEQFSDQVLRPRTTFFGKKKPILKQLIYSSESVLLNSLTNLSSQQQLIAIEIFRILLQIGRQRDQRQLLVFLKNLLQITQNISADLIEQLALQLLKQIHSNFQLCRIRMYQVLAVYLYLFNLKQSFVIAFLQVIVQKMGGENTETENDAIRYLCKKLLNKLQNQETQIKIFKPTSYQIKMLINFKKLPLFINLPIGNGIIFYSEVQQTFSAIKKRVLEEFGIDHSRFHPELFTFFEVITIDQLLEENPLQEHLTVWQTVSFWQSILQQTYFEENQTRKVCLMVKIKFAFLCSPFDEEAIELIYAQCLYDYVLGRIRLPSQKMWELAACARLIKMAECSLESSKEVQPILPEWIILRFSQNQIIKQISENQKTLILYSSTFIEIKKRFNAVCRQSALFLLFSVPTHQAIKIFLQPKRMLVALNSDVLEQYYFFQMTAWASDQEKFMFEVRRKDQNNKVSIRTHAVFTGHSNIINQYLEKVSTMLKFTKRIQND